MEKISKGAVVFCVLAIIAVIAVHFDWPIATKSEVIKAISGSTATATTVDLQIPKPPPIFVDFDQILKEKSPVVSNEKECEAVSGSWLKNQNNKGHYCLIPTKDGGDLCIENSECEVLCRSLRRNKLSHIIPHLKDKSLMIGQCIDSFNNDARECFLMRFEGYGIVEHCTPIP